jgi:predicted small lipoprotein YifL
MKYIWSLALASVLALSGCGGGSPLTLTEDNYNKVQNDMSESDVKAILGEPSHEDSQPIPIVGGTQTTLTYTNTQNGTTVTIVLKNDKVQNKTGHFSQ